MNPDAILASLGKIVLHRRTGRYGRVVGLSTADPKGKPFSGGYPRAVIEFATGREILPCRSVFRSVEYDYRAEAIDACSLIPATVADDKPQRQARKTKRGERV